MENGNNVRIKQILTYTIPTFGNNHTMPYFTAEITDGKDVKVCKSKGDVTGDYTGYQYITFKRKRYKVMNNGSLWYPKLTLSQVQ